MSKHPEYNDLMVEALYGEISPEDRRRLDAHLDACDACAEEFESLQATLDIMAQRKRSDRPDTDPSVRQRREDRSARAGAATRERSAWRHVLPSTSLQWAVQAGLALVLLAVGLWWGQSATSTPASTAESSATTADLLLARKDVSAEQGSAEPTLQGIRNVAFDEAEGTVELRYRTVNDVVLRGAPGDPAIQRLLRVALLDGSRPATQLHAMKVIERTSPSPTDDVIRALTYLVRKEQDAGMRLRALSALRSMYDEEALPADTRGVLVDLVLDDEAPPSLRVESLQILSRPSSGFDPDVLYAVRNDSNAYLRYRARESLASMPLQSTSLEHVAQ